MSTNTNSIRIRIEQFEDNIKVRFSVDYIQIIVDLLHISPIKSLSVYYREDPFINNRPIMSKQEIDYILDPLKNPYPEIYLPHIHDPLNNPLSEIDLALVNNIREKHQKYSRLSNNSKDYGFIDFISDENQLTLY